MSSLVIGARLFVPEPEAAPILGWPGLVVAGVVAGDGRPTLLLICDEGDRNPGEAAKDAIAEVLHFLSKAWATELSVRDSIVVVRDQAADFDFAVAIWGKAHDTPDGPPEIRWQPVKWPGAEMRSRAALEAVFGPIAGAALDAICSQVMLLPSQMLRTTLELQHFRWL